MFTGLDTETIDGKAVLVATSNKYVFPKNYDDILSFLSGDEYICWNASFDINAIIAWLPRKYWFLLGKVGKCVIGNYEHKFVARKVYEVIRIANKRREIMFRIYDGSQFYKLGSYLKLSEAAKKYLPEIPGKHDLGFNVANSKLVKKIISNKNSRRCKRYIEYCKHDAFLAQELFEKLRNSFEELGCEVDKPLSPAYLAGTYFLKGKKLRASETINARYKKCYYGGRVEVFRKGFFRKAFIYDINSAYPAITKNLPNINDCNHIIGKEKHENASMGVYKVFVKIDDIIGPLPHRKSVLIYPVGEFITYVDLFTLKMLEDNNIYHKILAVHEFISESEVRPFENIEQIYHLRKSNDMYNIACKKMLNGLYGKFAQQIKGWEIVDDILEADHIDNRHNFRKVITDGSYRNLVYASHITGGTRSMLYNAMSENKKAVIMVATDSIFSTSKLNLPVNDNLGSWSYKEVTDLLVVCNGIYSYNYKGKITNKVRGFNSKINLVEYLGRNKNKNKKIIDISSKLPLSLLYGYKSGHINTIGEYIRTCDLNSDLKRIWPRDVTCNDLLNNQYRSLPKEI